MKAHGGVATLLRIRLALMRYGWIKGGAALLCASGLLAWVWWIPALQAKQANQQQNWLRAQQVRQTSDTVAQVDPHVQAEENFNHFMEVLGDARNAEHQVKTLFSIAQRTGLTLAQAEYKVGEDKNGLYRSYQILLPVKGSYGAIRQFCEKTLLAIPFASLDEMSFKREGIATEAIEAHLRFTLYLSASSSGNPAASKPHLGKSMGAL